MVSANMLSHLPTLYCYCECTQSASCQRFSNSTRHRLICLSTSQHGIKMLPVPPSIILLGLPTQLCTIGLYLQT